MFIGNTSSPSTPEFAVAPGSFEGGCDANNCTSTPNGPTSIRIVDSAAEQQYGAYVEPEPSTAWTRFWGAAKAAGGILETAAGTGVAALTAWTGVGAVAGGAVAFHGADTTFAGLRQLFTGEDTKTLTSQGISAVTGSETAGEIVDAGIGIIGTAGVGAFSGVAKNAKLVDKSIVWTEKLAAGVGETGPYGSMELSKLGSAIDRAQVFIHEKLHSLLSPAADSFLARSRASARSFLYGKSAFMKYSEEAIAETAAQLGTMRESGLSVMEALKTGITFPIVNDYVKGERLAKETLGVFAKVSSSEHQVIDAAND